VFAWYFRPRSGIFKPRTSSTHLDSGSGALIGLSLRQLGRHKTPRRTRREAGWGLRLIVSSIRLNDVEIAATAATGILESRSG
jgi:hypothetical protein